MVQQIHPRGVIWVPSSRLMWADHQKNLTAVPSIYKEVQAYRSKISHDIERVQKYKVFATV